MKKIGNRIVFVGAFCLALASGVFAQNYKIRQTTMMSGQKMDSTIYVKGSRKRTESSGIMGMSGGVADVEQCDLKRNVKISDKKKMYSIEPFDDGADATPANKSKIQNPKSKIEKGGTVTLISNITDTGERKQMFGLTARRVKMSVEMQGSPDACNKDNMKVETDGWYVDLPEFSCPISPRPEVPMMTSENNGGCRDKIIIKSSGGGKLGFALSSTTTMKMGDDDGMSFTQTLETLEFSKATLDAALFDIPTGYKETQYASELYGKPDYSAMMKNQGGNDDDEDDQPPTRKSSSTPINNSASTPKKSGAIRVGVLMPTNKGEDISTTNMQMFLIQKLTSGNVEAVAVSSEADARSSSCDYVLSSDFSKLKQSMAGKIGGMFGKVTGGDPNALKNYDAQVDFKLVALTGGKNVSSKASNKSESNVDRAAESVLSMEAQQILSAIQK